MSDDLLKGSLFVDEPEDESEPNEWITTFADLTMLLLVFFILLYSMSEIDTKKFDMTFQSVTQAITGKIDKVATSRVAREEAGAILNQVVTRRQIIKAQRKVFEDVKYLQTTKGVEGIMSANFEDGKITIKLPGDVLFKPGQVELSKKGREAIKAMKDFFLQHPDQYINIKGYTDNIRPGKGSRLKDNWEFSSLRAVNVLRYLMKLGLKPNRLTATGLGEMNPVVPNSSPRNRQRNRRVEFVLDKIITGP
ncbi:OmpA/MotB family protein [Maridesulfovibrio hydrothermalis]|uniref:OmpA/MotB domain protein n=1 Tax=Maridesulfovibrio hydrothermalis AM13 = DSM 14728 TaxID=1121451 RepID=L0R997_9BACT|nr:flagellar motor protein MotB [Maridesulfovibrio hydrothermalis]CCO22156.1 OmpA/MotB domain protein [Maridesulfovibrio hydrothermalis AM13 = DSM 14728]